MNTKIPVAKTVDEYIKRYPAEVQPILQKIRQTIKKTAPQAKEVISYAIPGYMYNGMLIFFAAFKNHISVYPAPRGNEAFKKELSKYKGGKGTIQFPIGEPIPFDLLVRMIKFRLKDNEERAAFKNKKKVKPAAAKTKSSKPTDEEQVAAYMKNLKQMKAETEAVRSIIKNSNKKLSERIKWSAPSYYYRPARLSHSGGEDIVTFGPYKNGKILLVFHHPSIVKIKSGLLEGDYKDRRLVYLADMKVIKENKKELERIMKESVKAIDQKK
jgi:uncharacterized protein YdhG (YjbR/CyaY superfamily)